MIIQWTTTNGDLHSKWNSESNSDFLNIYLIRATFGWPFLVLTVHPSIFSQVSIIRCAIYLPRPLPNEYDYGEKSMQNTFFLHLNCNNEYL